MIRSINIDVSRVTKNAQKIRYSNKRGWTSFRLTSVFFTQRIFEKSCGQVSMLQYYVQFAKLPTVSCHNTCYFSLRILQAQSSLNYFQASTFIHRILSSFCGLKCFFPAKVFTGQQPQLSSSS